MATSTLHYPTDVDMVPPHCVCGAYWDPDLGCFNAIALRIRRRSNRLFWRGLFLGAFVVATGLVTLGLAAGWWA